jgi:hypothetical protein
VELQDEIRRVVPGTAGLHPIRAAAMQLRQTKLPRRAKAFMEGLGTAFSLTEPMPSGGMAIGVSQADVRIALKCERAGLGRYVGDEEGTGLLCRRSFVLSDLGALWLMFYAADVCWDAGLDEPRNP